MGRIVIAAYRPRPGRREALRQLVIDHVATLRSTGLITDRAAITMEAEDGTVIEIFEWKSKEAIEAAHSHPVVLEMWQKYGEVCEYVPVGNVAEAAHLFSEFTPIDLTRPEHLEREARPGAQHAGAPGDPDRRSSRRPGRRPTER